MKQTFFAIDCKTNLHVGSGKANYGVIDQLVQRDPTYQYPNIHATTLKGGIKEYCHHSGVARMVEIFGSEKGKDGKTMHETSQIGEYKFFDAMLLCIPVRCDKRAYVHVTCPNILEYLMECLPPNHLLIDSLKGLSSVFGQSNTTSAYCFTPELNGATIEDFNLKTTFNAAHKGLFTDSLKKLFKHEIVLVQNSVFDTLTNDLHLPVIARNYLENGESKNLWYEQVVPRLSRFWSLALHPETDTLFSNELFRPVMVQIGANGSVGYGYCSFSEI